MLFGECRRIPGTVALLFALSLFSAILSASYVHAEGRIYLGEVDGITAFQNLEIGQPITFVLCAQNDGATGKITGMTAGFRLYSPNGASWGPPQADWDSTSQIFLALSSVRNLGRFSLDGIGSDTIGVGLLSFYLENTIAQFDAPLVLIHTQFNVDQYEKTICIDSSFFRPNGEWVWGDEQLDPVIPEWGGGPYASHFTTGMGYCFTIVDTVTELYLSRVFRLDASEYIVPNIPLEFTMGGRRVGSDDPVAGSANGFRLYSPNGATWEPQTAAWDSNSILFQAYAANDLRFVSYFDWDGSGSDTVGFGGLAIPAPTTQAPFEEALYRIHLRFTSENSLGRTFCIDSSFYRPSGDWVWGLTSLENVYPGWGGGPYTSHYTTGMGYCFTIGQEFICGDINNDHGAFVDVVDLNAFVSYLFLNGPAYPAPRVRGNVDCSANPVPNIVDLVYLVKYLFFNGQPPCANCPM